jgi:putative chitobiose transport system substrate-binding protein
MRRRAGQRPGEQIRAGQAGAEFDRAEVGTRHGGDALVSRRGALRALAAGAAALACGVGGCSRRDGAGGSATIEIWTLALSPFFDNYIKGRIEAFEAATPGVRVTWVDVPYDALQRKLIAAAAAGKMPDVVNLPDLSFARFVALGALRPIDAELDFDPASVYLESALTMCRMERGERMELYALPWYVSPQATLINTKLIEAGGLTLEGDGASGLSRHWLGLLGQAAEYKNRTQEFLFSQSLGEESQLPIMLLAEGLVPLRETPEGLRANLKDPAITAYMERWAAAFREGVLPRAAATIGHSHLTEMYQQGRVAVIATGPQFLDRIRKAAPSVYETTAVREGVSGALGRNHMPVMVLGVSSATTRPREAAALAAWMTSAASQLEFCRVVPIMPSTKATLNDPYFVDPPRPEEGVIGEARRVIAASLSKSVAFTASLETWPDLRRAFQEEFKRVMTDGRDVGEAMGRVEREWDVLLKSAPRATLRSVPRPGRVESRGGERSRLVDRTGGTPVPPGKGDAGRSGRIA